MAFQLKPTFANKFETANEVRVLLPVGAGLDLISGKFLYSADGAAHLNGGMNKLMGVGGRGNTFKSTILRYFTTTVVGRYYSAGANIADTEDSVQSERVVNALLQHPRLNNVDPIETGLLTITGTEVMGNAWFDLLKEACKEKREVYAKSRLTTPFITKDGGSVTMLPPSNAEIDSLSMMHMDVVQAIYDKNQVGESGMNVEAMRSAAAKSQMLNQLPHLTTNSDLYMGLVAHMGDEIVIDQYAPSTKKLPAMKNKLKFKGVPERYTFLMNTLYACLQAAPLVNRSDKGPEYPRYSKERNPSNDLMVIELQLLRCKTAPSGNITYVVTSQEEGLLPTLSELHMLRVVHKYYGLGGNNTTFHCVFRPDVSMTRTNARERIAEDPLLARAINIALEIKQMHEYHSNTYGDVLVAPKELYEGLKAKGYDWDKLLNTRGYWVFKEQEEEEPLRELSSLDLLNMLAGKYTPANDKDYRS